MRWTVLHVSQPTDGGVAAVVRDLARHQLAQGVQTHVATPPGSPLSAAFIGTGVAAHPWAASRSPGPGTMLEARALARIVRRVAPDVIVLHSSKAGLAGRLALRGAASSEGLSCTMAIGALLTRAEMPLPLRATHREKLARYKLWIYSD